MLQEETAVVEQEIAGTKKTITKSIRSSFESSSKNIYVTIGKKYLSMLHPL